MALSPLARISVVSSSQRPIAVPLNDEDLVTRLEAGLAWPGDGSLSPDWQARSALASGRDHAVGDTWRPWSGRPLTP